MTVIPFHPVVPNPYMILGKIPPEIKQSPVLDLKDAFFYIPLDPSFQVLFAFEWVGLGISSSSLGPSFSKGSRTGHTSLAYLVSLPLEGGTLI